MAKYCGQGLLLSSLPRNLILSVKHQAIIPPKNKVTALGSPSMATANYSFIVYFLVYVRFIIRTINIPCSSFTLCTNWGTNPIKWCICWITTTHFAASLSFMGMTIVTSAYSNMQYNTPFLSNSWASLPHINIGNACSFYNTSICPALGFPRLWVHLLQAEHEIRV